MSATRFLLSSTVAMAFGCLLSCSGMQTAGISIPPGMRAVSVQVSGVADIVQGTRVDVVITGTPIGANERQTTTVLENVAVIAAGQQLERNSAGEAQNVPVITLLVSPDDAQRLTLASTEGHIQTVPRNLSRGQ
jgi:pilus assembly protein CpaB